ncbi:MAG TPA: hypothetical protein PK297_11780 [Spirochaetota bacterium]|nr:hypothetical protein [Spirochaetota bacterium]
MYYTYYRTVDFGTEMARKNILLHGENVHCFHNKADSILFAPHNAILPDFNIKAFARRCKDTSQDRHLPLADLDTAIVRVDEKGALKVRLTLPGHGARVWKYAPDFSTRDEIGTKDVIEFQDGWKIKGSNVSRNTVEFTISEDEFGYSAFSIEYEGWHRQLAFEWQIYGQTRKTDPRIRRRAAALALLDGDTERAHEDGTVSAFLQIALITGMDRWLEVYTGKTLHKDEVIGYLAESGQRGVFEDMLSSKLPELQISLFDSEEHRLQEYKQTCLEHVWKKLPIIPGRGEMGITGFYKTVLDALKSGEADSPDSDVVARAMNGFWKTVTV